MNDLHRVIAVDAMGDGWPDPLSIAHQHMMIRWMDRDLPFIRRMDVTETRKGLPLTLPDGAQPLSFQMGTVRFGAWQEAADGTWVLAAQRNDSDRRASFAVAAVTQELADDIIRRVTKGAKRKKKPRDGNVRMKFWYMASHGPDSQVRDIATPAWADIEGNYAAALREPLGRLMTLRPPELKGQLLVFHGPPGTGKTTLLRSLALAWRDWCDVSYIIDPEMVLNSGEYLIEAMLGLGGVVAGKKQAQRWSLIIMEDCGPLLRAEAEAESGQALGRLLNLTDGMLGQGRNVLLALTTNEPVRDLHPAITRPGRAIGEFAVPLLSREEAGEWLGEALPDKADTSLASLYALRSGVPVMRSEAEDDVPTGQYL